MVRLGPREAAPFTPQYRGERGREHRETFWEECRSVLRDPNLYLKSTISCDKACVALLWVLELGEG